MPRALDAIRLLNERGLRVILVTNQRGIALGRMSERSLADVHRRLEEEVALAGARIDAIYHCPHDRGACDCRKPAVGMFLQARRDFPELSFERSAIVGDAASDMQAGAALGLRRILVARPGDPALVAVERGELDVDLVVGSLWEAASALAAEAVGESGRE